MFKRTFKVVYRPVRSNFLVLPDQYYGVVSTYVSVQRSTTNRLHAD